MSVSHIYKLHINVNIGGKIELLVSNYYKNYHVFILS